MIICNVNLLFQLEDFLLLEIDAIEEELQEDVQCSEDLLLFALLGEEFLHTLVPAFIYHEHLKVIFWPISP